MQQKNAKCRSNNSHLSPSGVRHCLTDSGFTMCNKARWSHVIMVIRLIWALNLGQWNHNLVGHRLQDCLTLQQNTLFFTLRNGGMEEQPVLGWAVWCRLVHGQRVGPGSSHYSWNRSRVNTRQSSIGQCADLQQETEQGWGWAARSSTRRKFLCTCGGGD